MYQIKTNQVQVCVCLQFCPWFVFATFYGLKYAFKALEMEGLDYSVVYWKAFLSRKYY